MTTLSCGHKVFGDGIPVVVKSETRDCQRALDYMHVCMSCYDLYNRGKLILHTEKQQQDYLNNG
mgnify:CR=1 FL=1